MKKYKWHWSLFNLFSNTQAEVVKLQSIWGGLSAIITGATWASTNDHYAFFAAVGCALVDKIIACIYLEEIK